MPQLPVLEPVYEMPLALCISAIANKHRQLFQGKYVKLWAEFEGMENFLAL